MFFLALILAASVQTQAPVIVAFFTMEDKCLLSAMKANERPEVNTEEAKAAGATFVCLKVVDATY
jgi:hypothetical protein